MSNANLASYSLLGHSGLRVSPLGLGAMNFGVHRGDGIPDAVALDLLARYLDAGGNFVDTADHYTDGNSERLIGDYLQASGRRERVVLATKFSYNIDPGDPNAGGNSRKHIRRALEASLRRLKTDYVDLYWLNAWDGLTPLEEVMATLDDLVRAGKLRYIGLANVPAWYLARAQTLAELRGSERVAGLQLQYSLMGRHVELEHIPAALALSVGVCSWGALCGGLLTGKYRRSADHETSETRMLRRDPGGTPSPEWLTTEQGWKLIETVVEIATILERSPAQVALNWASTRPGITTTILGVTHPAQLADNLKALEFRLPEPLADRLEAAYRPELVHPYDFFSWDRGLAHTGGTRVTAAPAWHRPR